MSLPLPSSPHCDPTREKLAHAKTEQEGGRTNDCDAAGWQCVAVVHVLHSVDGRTDVLRGGRWPKDWIGITSGLGLLPSRR